MARKTLVTALLLMTGCASVGRIKKLEMAVARIDSHITIGGNKVNELEIAVARIDNHITIGGDGDSITTWILAVGLILLVLTIPAGGAFYQHVLRPRRKRKERCND